MTDYSGRRADRSDKLPHAPIAALDAHTLGVHVATLPAGSVIEAQNMGLTPYLKRAHDAALAEHVAQAATANGSSVFVLLVGDSTTGKSRALYETLNAHGKVRRWPVLRPADADELNALLEEQRVNPKTVLWLNETQKYLHGAVGEKAAYALSRLLETADQVIVAGAMWSMYYEELVRPGRPGDPTAGARELFGGPRTFMMPVPNGMRPDELQQLATLPGNDPRLAIAVATCGEGRRVIQHLTGGPELVEAYLNGSSFTAAEYALITAGLDARRLGHQTPLPGDLLANAADSYIFSDERQGTADWASSALLAIVNGFRPDGSRIDFRSVTALRTYRVRSGQGEPAYEPNAFLYQMTRARRQGLIGESELWDALAEFASSAEDLYRIGVSADSRGLYRRAAQMWFRAAAAGHPLAASALLERIRKTDPEAIHDACRWAAKCVNYDDPWSVGCFIRELGATEASQVVADLAARAIQKVQLNEPLAAAVLIRELRGVGVNEIAAAVASRAAAEADLDDLRNVGYLVRELTACNAINSVAMLASRIMQAIPDDLKSLTALIGDLRRAGAVSEVTALASQVAIQTRLDDLSGIAGLASELGEIGIDNAVEVLASRLAEEAHLNDALSLAEVIHEIRSAEANEAVAVLMMRAAENVEIRDLGNVAKLIHELGMSATKKAVARLAVRAAEEARLDDLGSVAKLIRELRMAKADESLDVLTGRIAHSAVPKDPRGLAMLIRELRGAGMRNAVSVLVARARETVEFEDPRGLAVLIHVLRNFEEIDAARVIGIRAAKQAINDPAHAASVIRELHEAGVDGALGSVAQHTLLSDTRHVAYLLRELRGIGAIDNVMEIGAEAARESGLDDPRGVALLFRELHIARRDDALTVLAARAADGVPVYDPDGIASLIRELSDARQTDALIQLAMRAVETVRLDDSQGVANLIHELNSAGAFIPATILAARAAEGVGLEDLWEVHAVIRELREMRADKAAKKLLKRAADNGLGQTFLAEFFETKTVPESAAYLQQFGREPNDMPSPSWGWKDLLTLERYRAP